MQHMTLNIFRWCAVRGGLFTFSCTHQKYLLLICQLKIFLSMMLLNFLLFHWSVSSRISYSISCCFIDLSTLEFPTADVTQFLVVTHPTKLSDKFLVYVPYVPSSDATLINFLFLLVCTFIWCHSSFFPTHGCVSSFAFQFFSSFMDRNSAIDKFSITASGGDGLSSAGVMSDSGDGLSPAVAVSER